MAFLIDTNIISEIQKGPKANPNVPVWYGGVADTDGIGIERLRRRDGDQEKDLQQRLARREHLTGDRILPVTRTIDERWSLYNVPDPISVIDV